MGEPDRTLHAARRAVALAEALDDQGRLARARGILTHALHSAGDAASAVRHGERALALARATGDTLQWVSNSYYLAQAHRDLGDFRRATELLEGSLLALGNDTGRWPSSLVRYNVPRAVSGRVTLAWALTDLGEFDRAMAVADDAARVDAKDSAYTRVSVSWGLAVPRLHRGDHACAIPVLERGLAIAREVGVWMWIPRFAASLGYAYALSGRLAEGLALLAEGVREAETKSTSGRGLMLSFLSQAHLLAGRPGDAMAVAQRGLTWTRERHERGDEASNLHALAEATASVCPPDVAAADAYYRQAIALATDLGMRPLVARCHAGLAKLFRRMGAQTDSDAHLQTATAMFRDMGMVYWLERLEAEVGEGAS